MAQHKGTPSDGRAMARRAGEEACLKLAGPPKHNHAMQLTSAAPAVEMQDSAQPAAQPQLVAQPVRTDTAVASASAAPAAALSSVPASEQLPAAPATAAPISSQQAPAFAPQPAPVVPLPAVALPVIAAPEPAVPAVSLAQDTAILQQPSSTALPAVPGSQAGSMQEQGPAAYAGSNAAVAAGGASEAAPALTVADGLADVPSPRAAGQPRYGLTRGPHPGRAPCKGA